MIFILHFFCKNTGCNQSVKLFLDEVQNSVYQINFVGKKQVFVENN